MNKATVTRIRQVRTRAVSTRDCFRISSISSRSPSEGSTVVVVSLLEEVPSSTIDTEPSDGSSEVESFVGWGSSRLILGMFENGPTVKLVRQPGSGEKFYRFFVWCGRGRRPILNVHQHMGHVRIEEVQSKDTKAVSWSKIGIERSRKGFSLLCRLICRRFVKSSPYSVEQWRMDQNFCQ